MKKTFLMIMLLSLSSQAQGSLTNDEEQRAAKLAQLASLTARAQNDPAFKEFLRAQGMQIVPVVDDGDQVGPSSTTQNTNSGSDSDSEPEAATTQTVTTRAPSTGKVFCRWAVRAASLSALAIMTKKILKGVMPAGFLQSQFYKTFLGGPIARRLPIVASGVYSFRPHFEDFLETYFPTYRPSSRLSTLENAVYDEATRIMGVAQELWVDAVSAYCRLCEELLEGPEVYYDAREDFDA